ncbi:DNA excision repair protein ERCC-6-like 2, partial [Oculina patagonica]
MQIRYECEGSEVVPVTALRTTTTEQQNSLTRKNTATDVEPSITEDDFFFTYLKGNEAEEIMRLKYGEYDVSSLNGQEEMDSEKKHDHMKTKVSVSSSKSKKKGKLNVLIKCNKRQHSGKNAKNKKKSSSIIEEAEEVSKMSRCEGNPPESPNTSTRNTTFDDAKSKTSENELDDENEMIADGFDDQDMERPSFTEPAVHPSVPLLLSKPGDNPVIQVPATINRYLRDYQRDGIHFLFQHYSENTGAILGDDMGLGKTVQVISFIAAVLGKTGTKADIFSKFMDDKGKGKQGKLSHEEGAFLVVSPGSVMYNWRDELETWGHFKTGLFHDKAREATLERASRGRLDVAVTTYETMRNHLDDLNQIKWLAVIMDEVHRLKDPKAQITVAAKALKVKRRYGLTGTPLQNKLAEFWCVLDWANPGSLGSCKKFEKEFGKPIRKGQPYDATKRELAVGRKKSKDLQSKIGRCFLRRTKDLIADQLPKKDELVAFCPLTPFQEDVYQTLLQNPDVEMIRKKNFPCDCGSGEDRGRCCYTLSSEGEDIKTVTMRFFQLLLKVANHAALLAPTVKQSKDQQEKAKELCLRVFARYPEFSGCAEMSSFELLSDPKYCGKMKVLEKLLKVFKEEHSKLLLFSRSTQLLNILEEFVISKGLVYSRLDGSTKPADRTRLVHEFNVDPSISLCLVSTKAGGLGLNFTGANVVIIFEPCWNPSSDLQAQD